MIKGQLVSETLHGGDYGVLDTADFYEKLRSYSDGSTQDMLDYVSVICEYLRKHGSSMAKKYEYLHANLLTVRQRRFAIQTSVARHGATKDAQKKDAGQLSDGVPWFPDVYERVKMAYLGTGDVAVKIVCLMIMGNVTEGECLAPAPEGTGILRIRDLTNTKIAPDDEDMGKCENRLYMSSDKLCVGKRLLSMGRVFMDGILGLRGLRGDLIVNSAGENDKRTYSWLCNAFDREVGYTIADVRLSYFNWRDITGAGHVELAEICRKEGYKAVITSEKLELGDKCAEFLIDCMIISDEGCVTDEEMTTYYEFWREDVGKSQGEEYLNASRVEGLTGACRSCMGNWYGLLVIDDMDEDDYGNRRC